MASRKDETRPEARLPKGFVDTSGEELRRLNRMLATIREVYELYGYEPLDTPAFEFTDALGKFLPDQDRPNAGVFSLQDDDDQWLSLRYDLTAPLARHVAENLARLPRPYRRYAIGPVWRNEKPGPGRFRQFIQCDADTVGTDNVAADAEACMLMADVIERIGIREFRIKLNNRKVLDGLLETAGIDPHADSDGHRRLVVLRAMDKFDKFGVAGVSMLLGKGRRDESGDFTHGAGLETPAIDTICGFLDAATGHASEDLVGRVAPLVESSARAREGLAEISAIERLVRAGGRAASSIAFDPSVVRGLDYYTGPVFEAELTFEVRNEDGQAVRFGSVGGGGRYDDLVARFTGERVPATGFSLGISRLLAALAAGDLEARQPLGPVVVLVMDKAEIARYQAIAQDLRRAGIRAEMYLGTSGMKPQMKYADRRGAPCVIIEGSDERAKGEIQIKDLIEGARAAAAIKDNKEWKSARPAQMSVPRANLVEAVRELIRRHGGGAS
ncbi:MAG: histidine--tRNA ligase [Hyphomicrobiaceae bacterium]|nr:histidine--tRNA ligase [Hyphomicrobiaceae bacterium]